MRADAQNLLRRCGHLVLVCHVLAVLASVLIQTLFEGFLEEGT